MKPDDTRKSLSMYDGSIHDNRHQSSREDRTGRSTERRVSSDFLLVGQPNVGKSVLFSRITGVRTISSNYPGTTVSYTAGKMRSGSATYTIVDAPGTYSLDATDEASRVTADLIEDTTAIVSVVDATHLERHLPFTLELLSLNKPVMVVLNMMDEARGRGISIDTPKLEELLGVPVIPVVARSGEGIYEFLKRAMELRETGSTRESEGVQLPADDATVDARVPEVDHEHRWARVGQIVEQVQTMRHHHPTPVERFEQMSVHPVWGTIIALIVVLISFSLIRLIGEFLISGGIGIVGDSWITVQFGTELLFDALIRPPLELLSSKLDTDGVLHSILIGELVGGKIDFEQSFGLLTSGLFIPLGVVLPYLLSFYLVLSILEDSGYLPRLAVFLDNIMHRLGLHGYAIIPMLLGLGCNVPGIMATRILETKRQRFIAATLISIAVPCAALQAMIIGLVGRHGAAPVLSVYGILVVVWLLISIVLRISSRGFRPELLVEIPPYRLPTPGAIGAKLLMRITGFFREALPVVFTAIIVVNLLYAFDVMTRFAALMKPLVTHLWGMPSESIVPLLIGILRKDVALGMLAPLDLTVKQLITGSVLLAMFFPCLATCVVLFRELGLKHGLKSLGVMIVSVVITGSVLNLLL